MAVRVTISEESKKAAGCVSRLTDDPWLWWCLCGNQWYVSENPERCSGEPCEHQLKALREREDSQSQGEARE